MLSPPRDTRVTDMESVGGHGQRESRCVEGNRKSEQDQGGKSGCFWGQTGDAAWGQLPAGTVPAAELGCDAGLGRSAPSQGETELGVGGDDTWSEGQR